MALDPLSDDTSAEAHAVQVELLRAMSPGQRLSLAMRLRRGAERMAEARLRATWPEDDDRRIRLRLAALRLGDALVKQVYGWDPAVEGR
jgi:hypothetical protein